VTDRSQGQISCPECDAPAPARARACRACGYRFLEDRRPGRVLALTAVLAAAAAAAVALIPGGDGARPSDVDARRPADRPRVPVDLLSNHPLSTHEAESLLEGRFTSDSDDDTAPPAARPASRARPTPSATAGSAIRTARAGRWWSCSTPAGGSC
jgi:ribosomal protein L40E